MLTEYSVIINQDYALTTNKFTVSRQLGFNEDTK
jgi:hypothetical protein